ncbi:NmrA-like family domain-containing protein 1 [Pleurostoma richardsiae]|uniref:NmrA-like family domain-containing protein 1 n=1 Tax=Pleurostoma richardsiae TaxID=41990 RepID=A0AA38RF52_9PEZI|nr:NmrA-like family domain-containing protein 1 [Pleurostoma richardsiae]
MASPKKKIFIIGGTGAQGMPVIRGLVSDGAYAVRVLTRNPASPRAVELASLSPDVEFLTGSFTSEADLRAGFAGCYGAFVNIDGFQTGEKTETFWAIRAYELAIESGIRAFVYRNLDFVYKKSGYKPEFRTGHYDGKGRIGEWILDQNKRNKKLPGYDMSTSLFTTGPYIEMAISGGGPMVPRVEHDATTGDKVLTWRVPLTADGAVVHVSLDDCAYYVRWLFDHPEKADGLDLEVAIEHVDYAEFAKAFEKVTGHKARFIDVDMDTYWREGSMTPMADRTSGVQADPDDPATVTVRQNFTGFWNMWRASGHNKGVIKRDYDLMDKIHPGRIRTVEEFLRREDEKEKGRGRSLWEKVLEGKPVLKIILDGQR